MDVMVDYQDVIDAHEDALKRGKEDFSCLVVSAEVDIDEALEEATVEQLRSALGREDPGYTMTQLDAIQEAFCAAASGDLATAANLLPRIFEHVAQIDAAEKGLRWSCEQRKAA